MDTFKAVLFMMCATYGYSQPQYLHRNSGWQNQGAPAGAQNSGASIGATVSYGNQVFRQFQNDWMPIPGPSMIKGSYGAAQQAAQFPVISPMNAPITPAAEEEAPETNAPLFSDVPTSTISTESGQAASTTVLRICTCRSIPSFPEAPATSSADISILTGSVNQAAEQPASVVQLVSSQTTPTAQQGAGISYGPFSSSSSQIQTSFTSSKNY